MTKSIFSLLVALISVALFQGCAHESRLPQSLGDQPGFSCHKISEGKRGTASAELSQCDIPTGKGSETKAIYLFKGQGPWNLQAYLHGYLFAEIAEANLYKNLVNFIDESIEASSSPKIARSLLDCYSSRTYESSSVEFISATENYIHGYQDAIVAKGGKPKYTPDQLRLAAVATDAGDELEGLEKQGTVAELEAVVSCKLTGVRHIVEPVLGKHHVRVGGCTGLSVPTKYTSRGTLIHARNLDGDLIEAFAGAPAIFMIDENTAGQPKKYYRYAAGATAGMFYPGGISGVNEVGIATSLHEMQSEKFTTHYSHNAGNIGPVLQEHILRSAKSIDEAYAIAKKNKNFIGWSIFVSDGKTGESATIEISGEKTALYRDPDRALKPRGQTNHFRAASMQDQFYNYDFNKYNETRARLEIVNRHADAIQPGTFTVQDAVDLLSNHEDAYTQGSQQRAFGRTVVKAYTSLSTIAVWSPNLSEFWLSSSERFPVPHSRFAGFSVDFSTMNAKPVGLIATNQYSAVPSWDKALDAYTRARTAYAHSKIDDAVVLLLQAKELAAEDHRYEPAFDFSLGRILLERGSAKTADPKLLKQAYGFFNEILQHKEEMGRLADFPQFRESSARPKYETMASYLEALTLLYSTHASDLYADHTKGAPLRTSAERTSALSRSLNSLNAYYGATRHFDLKPKIALAKKLQQGPSPSAELPEIDMVVVEN